MGYTRVELWKRLLLGTFLIVVIWFAVDSYVTVVQRRATWVATYRACMERNQAALYCTFLADDKHGPNW